MLKSVEVFDRDGKFEFLEPVPPVVKGKEIVTFLDSTIVDLAARGIDRLGN